MKIDTQPTGERILLVDDGDLIRTVLNRTLSTKYQVQAFSSSIEALEQFALGRYDLAIIDLDMPELSGDQLVARLRLIDPLMHTLLFTGNSLGAGDPRLAHFDFYIQKPNVEQLKDVIARALALRETHYPQAVCPHST